MKENLNLLNPFELSEGSAAFRKVYRTKRSLYKSQQRFKKILETYRSLLEDERYKHLAEEVRSGLGEQLTLLVKKSSECKNCSPISARVRVLQEVVLEPIEFVWAEAQRSRLEEGEEAEA